MASMMVLKCAPRSAQRSLKPSMKLGFKLLYHAHVDPLKVIRRILYMLPRVGQAIILSRLIFVEI